MLGHWYPLLFSGSPVVETILQGGLRAQFRRTETEEQKRVRREAQGIIKRLKTVESVPQKQVVELLDDSREVSRQLQRVIDEFSIAAALYQQEFERQEALKQIERAIAFRQLLIDAQLQAEQYQQQMEELDIAYIICMIAANIED